MFYKISALLFVLIFFYSSISAQDHPARSTRDGYRTTTDDNNPYGLYSHYLENKEYFDAGKNAWVKPIPQNNSAYSQFMKALNKFDKIKEEKGFFYKVTEYPPSIYHFDKKVMVFYDWSDSIKRFLNNNLDFITSAIGNDYALLTSLKDYGVSSDKLDSIISVKKLATEKEKEYKEKQERNWVYIGDFSGVTKYGEETDYAPIYYDINHLLYEGDSVCVVLKKGYSYYYIYKYVSLNLKTKIVHGIDASDYSGESYNYVWDGDWWKQNNEFADVLYNLVKR